MLAFSIRWLSAELYEVLGAAHQAEEVALALEVASRGHSSLPLALLEAHGSHVVVYHHCGVGVDVEVLVLLPVHVLSDRHAALAEQQLAHPRRHLLLRDLGHLLGMQAAGVDVAHDGIVHQHDFLPFDRHPCWVSQDLGVGDSVFKEREFG